MNYLIHHGIKGQKWGVRRYQNKDGTLTAEGRKRYTDKSMNYDFGKETNKVRREMSNSYSKFKKQPIDISKVKDRSGVSDKDAIECANLAEAKYREASKKEPKITNDVVKAVSFSGGKMYGLDYRLKQPTSMAGKIGSDSRDDGVSYQDAAKGIKDAIRYTSVSEGIDFVKNYNKTKKLLEQKGYSEKRLKNFFQRYSDGEAMHKAIQCTYVDKNGYEFEIQFQTPESQAAKELKVPIYEERRKQDISPDRAQYLEQQMIRLAENVPTPRNAFKIKEH